MIHGWITPEGKLILGGGSPTEQYALKCWFENYTNVQPAHAAVLEICTAKSANPEPV